MQNNKYLKHTKQLEQWMDFKYFASCRSVPCLQTSNLKCQDWAQTIEAQIEIVPFQ
jgi:hypothetical protein